MTADITYVLFKHMQFAKLSQQDHKCKYLKKSESSTNDKRHNKYMYKSNKYMSFTSQLITYSYTHKII